MTKKENGFSNEEQEELQELLTSQKRKIKQLESELSRLATANIKMELTLKENGLMDKINDISDAEAICVEQIRKLKEKSSTKDFTEQESKILDILHRNLKMARGEKVDKDLNKTTKKLNSQELLSIVKGE